MAASSFNGQNNLGWTFTFEANGKYPLIQNRIFDTKADVETFLSDSNTTAIPGLILRVIKDTEENNGVYLVKEETTDNGSKLILSKLGISISKGSEKSTLNTVQITDKATYDVYSETNKNDILWMIDDESSYPVGKERTYTAWDGYSYGFNYDFKQGKRYHFTCKDENIKDLVFIVKKNTFTSASLLIDYINKSKDCYSAYALNEVFTFGEDDQLGIEFLLISKETLENGKYIDNSTGNLNKDYMLKEDTTFTISLFEHFDEGEIYLNGKLYGETNTGIKSEFPALLETARKSSANIGVLSGSVSGNSVSIAINSKNIATNSSNIAALSGDIINTEAILADYITKIVESIGLVVRGDGKFGFPSGYTYNNILENLDVLKNSVKRLEDKDIQSITDVTEG